MSKSVGKQLHDTRVKRGLSVEEVAHATKLRPDKILALEQEDFGNFANNAYAKGFLQIYGRYLGVDISELWQSLDSSNPITVTDYQYLTNGIQQREPERATFSFSHKKQTPSIVPLIVFAALAVLGFMAFQLYVNWQRVTGDAVLARERSASEGSASEVMPASAITPAEAQPEPKPAAPVIQPADVPVVPGTEPVAPIAPTPAPAVAVPVVNEVLVEPIRKTWITVRRDDPKSAPVFEDFLYPDARPLKVKGASIYIEARDPSAILLRKNGVPIAYAPNAEIR